MSAAKLLELCLRHVPWTLLSLARLALGRRRDVLTLTHQADVDEAGEDAQMGPLVAALEARGLRRVPVVLVPLERGALGRARRRERGPFLSLAALLALARLLSFGAASPRARALVAGLVLVACRPRVAFLIDEAGSGQPFVAAARRRGVRTIGVQHGDFQPANRQYAGAVRAGRPPLLAPDVLCLWSPWFRERLFAISSVHDASNTRVTGRLAHARVPRSRGARRPGPPRVLFVADAQEDFRALARPFVEALRADAGLALALRPHPAAPWEQEGARSSRGPLERALEEADVVVGRGSSALLEALRLGRPAVVLAAGAEPDPAGYVAAGVAHACAEPARLPALCRGLARAGGGDSETLSASARVWGGAPPDPVTAVLAQGGVVREKPAGASG